MGLRYLAVAVTALGPTSLLAQDTIVVRADNAPLWGAVPRLVEEVRIGTLEGGGPTSFGRISGIVVDDDGVMWVADDLAAEIRRFDADGHYLGAIGRSGEGPGEFTGIAGIKRMPDGRIVVWDSRGGRFNFLSAEGEYLSSIPSRVGVIGGRFSTFQVDTTGVIYNRWVRFVGVTGPGMNPLKPGQMQAVWIKRTQEGSVVDTIDVPPSGRSVMGGGSYPFGTMAPFEPVTLSVMSPHGYLVVAHNERYAIHRPLADGRVLRIEQEWEPVRVQRSERSQYAELAAHVATLWDPALRFTDDVPNRKPPFWAIRTDEQGRLWVATHSEGTFIEETPEEREERRKLIEFRGSEPPPLEWWEPLITDVIEPNGRFLGTLRFPSNQAVVVAARDLLIWAVELGEYDEEYVVRYRVEPGG